MVKSRKSSMEEKSSIAFISMSNCEQALSGRPWKRSSSSSLTSAGEVGGVENGFDWTDERDGVDEPFNGLDWTGSLAMLVESEECGRHSAGDMGGV